MKLAQLFYAKHPRRPRDNRARSRRETRFRMEPLEPRLLLDVSPAVLPSLVTGSLDHPGEHDTYTFKLGAETRVYFDSQTNNSNIRWTLDGPAGTSVQDRPLSNSDAVDGETLLTLPEGKYTLTVAGVGDTTGAYTFQLLDLATATPLTPGVPVSGTLDPATETDMFQFAGTEGERLFFDAQARSGATSARWRLVDQFSNVVFERDFGGTASDVGPLSLPRTGTYTLLLEGRVFDGGVGAYTFNVEPVTDETFPLALGTTVQQAIDEPGAGPATTSSTAARATIRSCGRSATATTRCSVMPAMARSPPMSRSSPAPVPTTPSSSPRAAVPPSWSGTRP